MYYYKIYYKNNGYSKGCLYKTSYWDIVKSEKSKTKILKNIKEHKIEYIKIILISTSDENNNNNNSILYELKNLPYLKRITKKEAFLESI